VLQIDLGDPEIQGGLLHRLVLDVEHAQGVVLVPGAETGLLAGAGIFAIEDAGTSEQEAPLFHADDFLVLNREPIKPHQVKETLI